MANGIELRLYNGATARASLTGLTCLWWDAEDVYDFGAPQGRTDAATTDADGDLILDISNISGHAVGGVGYLLVRKEDVGNHEDSLVFQGKVTVANITGGTVLVYVPDWTRPTDWIAIDDTHTPGESRFEGLYAVWDGALNHIAFTFTVTGGYTVDWGDGSAPENVASGVKAQHLYDFADLGSGTTTSDGYRQAIVSVVPQGANPFTGVSLTPRHSAITLGENRSNGWLDIYLCGPSITTLAVSTNALNAISSQVLEQVNIPELSLTSAANLFLKARRLQSIKALDISGANSLSSAFQECICLASIPLIDTSSCTNFQYAFYNTGLRSVPLLNTSAGTLFVGMFLVCASLTSIPTFDTSNGTTFNTMFNSCYSILSIPAFDLSSATGSMQEFVNTCSSLREFPLLDFSAITDVTSLFGNNQAVIRIPALDFSNVTTYTSSTFNCPSLQKCEVTGIKQTVTFANSTLGADALNEIFTNLATVVGKTITVTGNPGILLAGYDATIATAKGWTVVA